MSLENKSFVVFGAASGLGQATATALMERGANVTVSDRTAHGLDTLESGFGPKCTLAIADVLDEGQVGNVLAAASSRFGRIDGVITTAGILHGEKILGKSGAHALSSFERVVSVNLTGSFNVLRLAADAMSHNEPGPDGERGVIVHTASIAAFDGQVGQVAYAASKAAVAGMVLPAARELARCGIRVVAIAPGLFGTPMVAGLSGEVKVALEELVPFPSRLGDPAEYAALACHVIENRMLNGTTIRLDGALRMPPR
ncbi:SDR family NAD(P)-dependent oxidoreductase [Cupriavidus sp. BIC8F]|uniref:SDR family NAD(P)-dependent oxidoreductase n=1 Tax=Cupriavidus sp. BIC8F TaxID=3079014 RepID=UPI002915F4C2|nr:SDR family NAD(P)-dependent oxidoreductase [Cupriavidus sp. BIC8F]